LEAAAVEIKDLIHKLDHSSRYTILSPPCEEYVSLKGKLLHATKENTELQQEVAYLTAHLDKIVLSEKIIKEDLSRVEQSATKSTYKLGVGFERCEKKVRRVLLSLFLAPATIKKRKHSNQPKPIAHPIQSHPSTQREK
jgi:predicted nuclease with TOPRIM domain